MAEKMTDEDLRVLVESGMDNALGASDTISAERAKAWDYYLSRKMGNEVEGQSQVVSSDVSDVVDGIMPSLLRIFTTADNLVMFDPVGPEDEEAAQQESDYVNYVFFKQNPSMWIMFCWFFDALVQKNGIVKAWWDESKDVEQRSYTGLDNQELAKILFETGEANIEVIEYAERVGPVVEDVSVEIAPGGAVQGQVLAPGPVHDITFNRVLRRGRARIEPVPPEEYRISSDSRSLDPSDARLVGHERLMTRSDLIEMGFKKKIVNELPAIADDRSKLEQKARKGREKQDDAPRDKSQDTICFREVYIKVDYDGDGVSELRQVQTGGGQLLSNEIVDRQPFHVLTPQPLPHKHFGRATAEKVMDIQDVGTTLQRQMLDNLYRTNNPSHAVWEMGMGENTLDDLLTNRIGQVNRFSRPVNESYAPLTVPFTAAQTFPMLDRLDKVKRDRTGVSSDSEGLSPEALKNIQTTVLSQAVDLSKMKIEMIARIFAETGIKSLFRHIHELLQKHQNKPQVVKLRNKWEDIDPEEWSDRDDMTVLIGLGIGTRQQNLIQLEAIWQKQIAMAQGGGMDITVTPKNFYNTAAEFVKNANLQDPELFFRDPGNEKGAQKSDEAVQLQQQQLALQARQQELDAERQAVKTAELQLREQKQELDALNDRIQLQLDVAEQERKRQADDDKFTIEQEKIRNELTELDLKYSEDVPGSLV